MRCHGIWCLLTHNQASESYELQQRDAVLMLTVVWLVLILSVPAHVSAVAPKEWDGREAVRKNCLGSDLLSFLLKFRLGEQSRNYSVTSK